MTVAVDVGGERPYQVLIGPGALDRLADGQWSPQRRRVFVVTDANVERLHAGRLGPLAAAARVALAPGEASKSFAVLEQVLEAMAAAGLDRAGLLVAFGGGVVGDVGGLAAALYMRGIDFVQCPTTLLAQIDSSVGGKTAVNLAAGKNLAGAFHAPRAVLADTLTLATLPPQELASGLGELVKTALIAGEKELAAVEADAPLLRAGDPAALARAIPPAVAAKAGVVARDERESGPREVLNLGHTFAHGIERAAGLGRVPHGVAVAAGLGLALEASSRLGVLLDRELPERVRRLLVALDLPPDLEALRRRAGAALTAAAIVAAARRDKKGRGGTVRLVLPVRAGEVRYGVAAGEDVLLELAR